MADFFENSLIVHQQLRGKTAVHSNLRVAIREDLSLAYELVVARPRQMIATDPTRVRDLSIKRNTDAVFRDGSAVLGLGHIGPMRRFR